MILTLSFASIGAWLFWQERDDTTEKFGPFKLTSGFWTGVIIVLAGFLIQQHHVEPWRFIVALALFVYVLTASHNLLLSPPSTQVLGPPRDVIQRALYWAFRKQVGDTLGLPAYVVYSVIRYALPVSLMGFLLGNDALLYAGPAVSAFYYPYIHSEKSKYYRAAIAGGLIVGGLAA